MSRGWPFGTAVPYRAQAFGFDIRRPRTRRRSFIRRAHEFGDTKYRRVVYHGVATTRFREFLPRPLTDVPENIQRRGLESDAAEDGLEPLVHHIPSSARPAAPAVVQSLPTFRWERHDEGHEGRTSATARRCASGYGGPGSRPATASSSVSCSNPPSARRPVGVTPFDVMDQAALPGLATSASLSTLPSPSQGVRTKPQSRAMASTQPAGSFCARALGGAAKGRTGEGRGQEQGQSKARPAQADARGDPRDAPAICDALGKRPVWASKLPRSAPQWSPTSPHGSPTGWPHARRGVAQGEGHRGGAQRGLLRHRPDAVVFGHRDRQRRLIFYPFVRLALARYPAEFAPRRAPVLSMTDFMPARPGSDGRTGRGIERCRDHGPRLQRREHHPGRMWSPIFSDILFEPDDHDRTPRCAPSCSDVERSRATGMAAGRADRIEPNGSAST